MEMNANPKRKSRQGNRVRAERARWQHQEEALDDALKNTFPASDPISIEKPGPPAWITTEDETS
jgi:hypothetical protein